MATVRWWRMMENDASDMLKKERELKLQSFLEAVFFCYELFSYEFISQV